MRLERAIFVPQTKTKWIAVKVKREWERSRNKKYPAAGSFQDMSGFEWLEHAWFQLLLIGRLLEHLPLFFWLGCLTCSRVPLTAANPPRPSARPIFSSQNVPCSRKNELFFLSKICPTTWTKKCLQLNFSLNDSNVEACDWNIQCSRNVPKWLRFQTGCHGNPGAVQMSWIKVNDSTEVQRTAAGRWSHPLSFHVQCNNYAN